MAVEGGSRVKSDDDEEKLKLKFRRELEMAGRTVLSCTIKPRSQTVSDTRESMFRLRIVTSSLLLLFSSLLDFFFSSSPLLHSGKTATQQYIHSIILSIRLYPENRQGRFPRADQVL